jgi:hypothetical protein
MFYKAEYDSECEILSRKSSVETFYGILTVLSHDLGYAVAQLNEALRYKPKGRWNFSLA